MKTFEEKLESASAGWLADGVIGESQRAEILRRHPVMHTSSSRFVGIMATLGGLLLAIGVSLLIKANWQALGDWTKIAGLAALLVAAYATGWKLKCGDGNFPKTGDALLMVGAILFLLGIALVSQIFHLNARPASGVFIWWLGIALVPWLARAKGAQFTSLAAFFTWLAMEMHAEDSWLFLGKARHDFVVMIGLAAVFFFLGLALWFSGIGLRSSRWRDFAGVHEKWGLLLAGGALYSLGFARHGWRWATDDFTTLHLAPALGLGIAFALAAAVWIWRVRELRTLAPWIALALVPVLGALIIGPLNDEGWLWSMSAWGALLALALAVSPQRRLYIRRVLLDGQAYP
jgi:uncharacterized membrane protein